MAHKKTTFLSKYRRICSGGIGKIIASIEVAGKNTDTCGKEKGVKRSLQSAYVLSLC